MSGQQILALGIVIVALWFISSSVKHWVTETQETERLEIQNAGRRFANEQETRRVALIADLAAKAAE